MRPRTEKHYTVIHTPKSAHNNRGNAPKVGPKERRKVRKAYKERMGLI